jgi:hypothetical protein
MSEEAFLPCFVCGKRLLNVFPDISENQPSEGTEFRTYGHYGSTFWDSFDGEELVLNVCDPCLRERTDRLAQQKRYLPVSSHTYGSGMGRQWVERPMVPYTGHTDPAKLLVDDDELGTLPGVEWETDYIADCKRYANKQAIVAQKLVDGHAQEKE